MTEKLDVYSRVTDKIIADLERGNLTWLQPWRPENITSLRYLTACRRACGGQPTRRVTYMGYASPLQADLVIRAGRVASERYAAPLQADLRLRIAGRVANRRWGDALERDVQRNDLVAA